ncbi:MAG: hypothetical protein AB9919_13000 [Geobacteraceae bacterium]
MGRTASVTYIDVANAIKKRREENKSIAFHAIRNVTGGGTAQVLDLYNLYMAREKAAASAPSALSSVLIETLVAEIGVKAAELSTKNGDLMAEIQTAADETLARCLELERKIEEMEGEKEKQRQEAERKEIEAKTAISIQAQSIRFLEEQVRGLDEKNEHLLKVVQDSRIETQKLVFDASHHKEFLELKQKTLENLEQTNRALREKQEQAERRTLVAENTASILQQQIISSNSDFGAAWEQIQTLSALVATTADRAGAAETELKHAKEQVAEIQKQLAERVPGNNQNREIARYPEKPLDRKKHQEPPRP